MKRSVQAMAGGAAGMLASLALVTTANAQNYPTKPVRLIVSVNPGGNLDLVGRSVAQAISEGLGRQVIVENRPGANSTIGTSSVARSAPDGHTLVMIAGTFLIAPLMMKAPPFDPLKDFVGVSQITALAQMLVVHPSMPIRSVKELIAFAKARPGELNFSTSGNGSGSHMGMEMFMRQAGVKMTRIPYNGDAQALVNLVGGQVPVKIDNLSTSTPHILAGRVRALGVTSLKRTPLFPDVPAIAETLPGFDSSIFNGMAAPAATPPAVVARLHSEIQKFIAAPENRARFGKIGVELRGSESPEAFTRFLRDEYVRLGKVLEEAGIKAN